MYFGMPTSCSFGLPEDIVLGVEPPLDLGSGCRQRVKMIVGYAQYGRFIVDGVPQGNPQYIVDTSDVNTTEPAEFRGLYDTNTTNHTAQIMPQGDWSSPLIDTTPMSVFFQIDRGDQFNVSWFAAPEIFSSGDAGQLTSWDFDNSLGQCTIIRFANCKPNQYRHSWGELDINLTTDAGVHTLELSKNGVVMASGSRTGNGTITLTAENESGIEGTVLLTYTADIVDGVVSIRFPESYAIHYKTTPFGGGDFPRTPEDTVLDDGLSGSFNQPFTYTSPALADPTYYVVIHQVDDAGNEGTGTQGGGAVINLNQPPEPPGTPTYLSGDYSNTMIQFDASSTSGATYNVYDSLDTGIMIMGTPNHTIP